MNFTIVFIGIGILVLLTSCLFKEAEDFDRVLQCPDEGNLYDLLRQKGLLIPIYNVFKKDSSTILMGAFLNDIKVPSGSVLIYCSPRRKSLIVHSLTQNQWIVLMEFGVTSEMRQEVDEYVQSVMAPIESSDSSEEPSGAPVGA